MNFYVTLPSNSSMDLFPENTMSDFSIQLKEPIRLDVSFEVALVELTYKHSWSIQVGKIYIDLHENNLIDQLELVYHDGESISSFTNRLNSEVLQHFIKAEYDKRYKIGISNDPPPTDIKIPHTQFESLDRDQSVVSEITSTIIQNIPQFRSEKFRIYIYLPENIKVRFEGNILKILNLEERWYENSSDNKYQQSGIIDDQNPNIIQSLFVYCDIIDYQYVGDAYVPLLRNVVVDNNYLKTAWIHYDNPHYVLVNKSEVSTIKIQLRDDTGEKIRFEQGKVIVKLHFRQKRL